MNIRKTKLLGVLAAFMVITLAPWPAHADSGALVSIDWLADNLDKPNVVVLDVGTFFHYEKKHIPGAVKAFGPWQTVNEKHLGYMMPPVDALVEMIQFR